jgi:hypothetical protein
MKYLICATLNLLAFGLVYCGLALFSAVPIVMGICVLAVAARLRAEG